MSSPRVTERRPPTNSILPIVVAAARAQFQMTTHNVEDVMPVLTIPLLSVVSTAILVHAGRVDLADHALVASLLMTVGQMGLFVGSEVVARDRNLQTLELAVASAGPYVVVLTTRIFLLTVVGLIGFVEGWLIAWWVFDIRIAVQWPGVFLLTVVATTLAITGTCVVAAAFAALFRNTRTFQHALNGPFYLLGGVLVPITYLPEWLQPVCRLVFFSWSADLLRDTFRAAAPADVALRLSIIVGLGVASGLIGVALLRRVFDHLRREGSLGLT
jgi:ABC-2 type transport system permease protein